MVLVCGYCITGLDFLTPERTNRSAGSSDIELLVQIDVKMYWFEGRDRMLKGEVTASPDLIPIPMQDAVKQRVEEVRRR